MSREQLIEDTRKHFAGFLCGLVELKIIGWKVADYFLGVAGIDSPLQTECAGQQKPPPIRIPPNDMVAERAVLGGILLDNDVLDIIKEILHAEDFYSPANRLIFSTMIELAKNGLPVDVVTLHAQLDRCGELQSVGGDDYLLLLTNVESSVSAVEANAKVVFEKAVTRKLIGACREVVEMGYADDGLIEDFLDSAKQKINKVCEGK